MRHRRLVTSIFLLASLILNLLPVQTSAQSAPPTKPVVINEIAWAGTGASGNDEWIELFNTTSATIDLSGWNISDDNGSQVYTIASGSITAGGYFLIEDSEETSSIPADAITNLSFANNGDSLTLVNAAGVTIDTVNNSGGAWYAGSASNHGSMELRDAAASSDQASEWSTNNAPSGALDRAGNTIPGTPRAANSASQAPSIPAQISLVASSEAPEVGETVTVSAEIVSPSEFFSYGFDVSYDPTILEFIDITSAGFLSQNGTAQTSFQGGLLNGAAGTLVVGESRIHPETRGVSGSGTLFTMSFRVTGAAGSSTSIQIAASNNHNFLASRSADRTAQFSPAELTVEATVVAPVEGGEAVPSAQNRYAINLSWQASNAGADLYRILRRDASGIFTEIGDAAASSFTDTNAIIPQVIYEYQIIAVRNGAESSPILLQASETRGVRGDNNRSDRVDGRDLQRLAQHFTQMSSEAAFEPLVDTTYDGRIDGSDLIDLAANWAVTYTP